MTLHHSFFPPIRTQVLCQNEIREPHLVLHIPTRFSAGNGLPKLTPRNLLSGVFTHESHDPRLICRIVIYSFRRQSKAGNYWILMLDAPEDVVWAAMANWCSSRSVFHPLNKPSRKVKIYACWYTIYRYTNRLWARWRQNRPLHDS